MKIKILGSGQDDGIPQIGCYCKTCNSARKQKKSRRLGPSIALISKKEKLCYLFDVSPDLKYQIDMLKGEGVRVKRKGQLPISGIFLTHAHFGHCSGIWCLGRESVDERNLPVFCTPKMGSFLNTNYPFNMLIKRKNIVIKKLIVGREIEMKNFSLSVFEVPHRNEIADTIGYEIQTKKRVLYIPDVDCWTEEIIDRIKEVEIAIIDGTFYSKSELSRYNDVPHPPIQDTMRRLRGAKTQIYFTHINHTNSVNTNREKRRYVENRGFHIAYDGMSISV